MKSIYEALTELEEAVGEYDEALERLRDSSEEGAGGEDEALRRVAEARRRLVEVVRSLSGPLEYREDEPADIECLDDIRALLVYVKEVLVGGEGGLDDGLEPSGLEEHVDSAIEAITDRILRGVQGLSCDVREHVVRRLSF